MPFGYWNKVLHINLSDRSSWVEEPGDAFYRDLQGGRGFIARYLLENVPAGADPLGPDNVLVFAMGVMTGVALPGAGRHSVGAKSPLTGGFGESESGGFWGAEVKRAGWDAIVVHGASETPVYLWIKEDQPVEFRDASHLWGMTTGECEEAIVAELGDQWIRTCQIGPAGEHLVRFANVNNDLNEVAGRTGMGAVMGSKKLKAIAVRGTKKVPVFDPKPVQALAKWVATTLEENHRAFHEFGTGAAMVGKHLQGGLPTLNYQFGEWEPVGEIDAVAVRDKVRVGMKACYACSVRCKKVVRVEEREGVTDEKGRPVAADPKGRWSIDPKYGGPEYETLASFGNTLGVDDLIAICKGNELANALGMDTISLGTTIAWAMECYEKGILTDEDTGGVPFKFGNAEMVIEMIRKVAYREGFGDLLAEGSQRAAARIGRGSEEFLTTVKGMEMAMHDPRHMPEMRPSYLLAPTGGDHMRQTSDKNAFRNQAGICFFLNYKDEQVLDVLNAVTGWGVSQEDVVQAAHRGLAMARLFNMREGFGREHDALPKKFQNALAKHPGLSPELQDQIVTDYYREHGWNEETGRPTTETIERLGLCPYIGVAV